MPVCEMISHGFDAHWCTPSEWSDRHADSGYQKEGGAESEFLIEEAPIQDERWKTLSLIDVRDKLDSFGASLYILLNYANGFILCAHSVSFALCSY